MTLQIGQKIKGESLGTVFTVKKKLGEGTQGEVFLVEGEKGISLACKWYKLSHATEEQRSAIRTLVRGGPPRGTAGSRFIWPLDLVTAQGSSCFGYTMKLIDTRRFAGLGEVQAHLKKVPTFSSLCTISYQLANSYRTLHLNRYCYRDISDGNLMFDPLNGDMLICDNDTLTYVLDDGLCICLHVNVERNHAETTQCQIFGQSITEFERDVVFLGSDIASQVDQLNTDLCRLWPYGRNRRLRFDGILCAGSGRGPL